MVLPFFYAALLTTAYYCNSKTSFFAHTDPVPWLRSVLGRELVLVMYTICLLRSCLSILCPVAIFLPLRMSIPIMCMSCGVAAFYLAPTQTGIMSCLYDYTTWASLWSIVTSIVQQAGQSWTKLFLVADVLLRVIPSSLYFACDCVFVFCLSSTVSRVVIDCAELWSFQPTPQPRRRRNQEWFQRCTTTFAT